MRYRRLAFAFGTALLAACGSAGNGTGSAGGTGGSAAGCEEIDPSFAAVLSKPLSSCSGFEPPCHNLAAGGLHLDRADAAGTWAALVDVDASTPGAGKLVVPGDPVHSFLYRKLTNDLSPDEGDPMPRPRNLANATWQELPRDQLDTLRCWIAAGAKKD